MKINEYSTSLSSIWEEIESMNLLHVVTTVDPGITALLNAINTQREEAKLLMKPMVLYEPIIDANPPPKYRSFLCLYPARRIPEGCSEWFSG